MERTQPTPTSEAPPSADACAVLDAIAGRLATQRPGAAIDEARRMALALTYATDRAGFRTNEADALEREVLAHMPRITGEITRGEYSLLLRHAAKGDR